MQDEKLEILKSIDERLKINNTYAASNQKILLDLDNKEETAIKEISDLKNMVSLEMDGIISYLEKISSLLNSLADSLNSVGKSLSLVSLNSNSNSDSDLDFDSDYPVLDDLDLSEDEMDDIVEVITDLPDDISMLEDSVNQASKDIQGTIRSCY